MVLSSHLADTGFTGDFGFLCNRRNALYRVLCVDRLPHPSCRAEFLHSPLLRGVSSFQLHSHAVAYTIWAVAMPVLSCISAVAVLHPSLRGVWVRVEFFQRRGAEVCIVGATRT